jgi:ribosome biogenesis protein MAK21
MGKKKFQQPQADSDDELTLDMVREFGGDARDLDLIKSAHSKGQSEETDLSAGIESILKAENPHLLKQSKDVIGALLQRSAAAAKPASTTPDNKKEAKQGKDAKPGKDSKDAAHAVDTTKKTGVTSATTENGKINTTTPATKSADEPKESLHAAATAEELKALQDYILSKGPVSIVGDRNDEKNADFLRALRHFESYAGGSHMMSRSDAAFIQNVMRAGTLSDKIAAMALQVQSDPERNTQLLIRLVLLCHKKGRREAMLAIETLRDLFNNHLLPGDGAADLLYYGDGGSVYQHLLKKCYARYIDALGTWAKDTVIHSRTLATRIAYDLLISKSEQEDRLLALIVNKLGDPERRVASHSSYLLSQLLVQHPAMKEVVVRDVERFLFRSHIQARAQYYAMVFLNQIILTKADSKVASLLIDIYMSLFRAFSGLRIDLDEDKNAAAAADANKHAKKKNKKALKREKEAAESADRAVYSHMLSAILTGVSRAYPFVVNETDPKVREKLHKKLMDHCNHLFRIAHTGSFSSSTQSLSILFHMCEHPLQVSNPDDDEKDGSLYDRYMRALYESLLHDGFRASTHPAVFFNLVYRSLKRDAHVGRLRAFVKRLLAVVMEGCVSNVVCASLYMVSKLVQDQPSLKVAIMMAEERDLHDAKKDYDPFKRQPEYSNADRTSLYELVQLVRDCHPTVHKFADALLKGEELEYKGDPLEDFSLMAFLEKFVLRKPKVHLPRGQSIMQKIVVDNKEGEREDEEVFVQRFYASRGDVAKQRKAVEEDDAEEEEEEMQDEDAGDDDDDIGDADMDEELDMDLGDDEDIDVDDDDAVDIDDDDDDLGLELDADDDDMDTDDDDIPEIDEDEEEVEQPSSKTAKKKGGKVADLSAFADAEEYERMLEDAGRTTKEEQHFNSKSDGRGWNRSADRHGASSSQAKKPRRR